MRYPDPRGTSPEATSGAFALSVNNSPVFIDHWQDSYVARFAVSGAVSATVSGSSPVSSYRVFPARAFSHVSIQGNSLVFTLTGPANAVVEWNGTQRLFLFADPFEVNPPHAGQMGVLNINDYGVDSSGTRVETVALQRALDDAGRRSGGGTLLLPAGTYLTGTISIPSHVTLYLAPGATLRGSRNLADYPRDPGRHENGSDASITDGDTRFLGQFMTFSRLILVDNATDVHIRGRGTIDADGTYVRNSLNGVPNIIRVRESSNVSLEDILLRDSPAWTVHLLKSRDVTVENVKIVNSRNVISNDGFNPDSAQDVTINNSFVYTNDDAVSIKASNNSDLLANVSNIAVTNCVMSSSSGGALKLGTESQAATFSQISFENNDVFASDRAMSVVVRDGATYQGVAFKTVNVHANVTHIFEQVIGVRRGNQVNLGSLSALAFAEIEVEDYAKPASNWTWYTQFRPDHPSPGATDVSVFEGADAAHAVHGLTLTNLSINGSPVRTLDDAARLGNITFGSFVDGVTVQ